MPRPMTALFGLACALIFGLGDAVEIERAGQITAEEIFEVLVGGSEFYAMSREQGVLKTPEARMTGDAQMFGLFKEASFVDGMSDGFIMSTGRASDAASRELYIGQDFGPQGPIDDEATYSIRFETGAVPTDGGALLEFQYVFASREMPQYGGDQYNDNFKIEVKTTDITGACQTGTCIQNIAWLDEANRVPLEINTITPVKNDDCNKNDRVSWSEIFNCNFLASSQYVEDGQREPAFTNRQHFGYTGYTDLRTSEFKLPSDSVVELNISITDVSDGIFDSAIFIKSNSLRFSPLYDWKPRPWSECSKQCGPGDQTRDVVCMARGQSADSAPSDPSNCAATKPATTRRCEVAQCEEYRWDWTDWSPCSVSCGGGERVRSAVCLDEHNAVVDGSNCERANLDKPTGDTVMACNTEACAEYVWDHTEWSACSHSCDGGVTTRTIVCRNVLDIKSLSSENAPDSKCTAVALPNFDNAVQKPCNEQPCQEFTWQVEPWGGCSTSCGGGVRDRELRCIASNGMSVDPSQCSKQLPSEPLFEHCNPNPCYKYAYDYTSWGYCSASCGEGVTTRRQPCLRSPVRDDGSAPVEVPEPESRYMTTSAVADFTATSTAEGVYGQVTFTQVDPSQPTQMHVRIVGSVGNNNDNFGEWHVHVSPRDPFSDSPCDVNSVGGHYNPTRTQNYPCTGDASTCEVGDLSGKFGSLDSSNVDEYYSDPNLQLSDIVGRSLVVHDERNNAWVCADIVEVQRGPLLAQTENFCDSAQMGSLPLIKDCFLQSCPNYEYRVGEWTACTATCGVGVRARDQKCYPAQLADAVVNPRDQNLEMMNTPVSNARCESVSAQHVACSDASYPLVATASFRTSYNDISSGTITFRQENRDGPTVITLRDLTGTVGSGKDFGEYHIHVLGVDENSPDPCGFDSVRGRYNPTQKPYPCNTTKKDGCELGDLSGKFGPLPSSFVPFQEHIDYELDMPLILGRSVVIHDKNSKEPWVCATIKPDGPGCQPLAEPCFSGACEEYKYEPSEWGSCSLTCGGGIKRRELTCKRRSDDEEVDAKHCTTLSDPIVAYGSNGVGIQLDAPCAEAPCVSYDYKCEDWTSCSVTCETGVRERRCGCVSREEQPLSYPLEATADFGELSSEVQGTISFYQESPESPTEIRVNQLLGAAGSGKDFGEWHIHEEAVDVNSDDKCGPLSVGGHYNPTNKPYPCIAKEGCEVGDLSGKHGNLPSSYVESLTATDRELRLSDLIGRSVVLHDAYSVQVSPGGNTTIPLRWACATIFQTSRGSRVDVNLRVVETPVADDMCDPVILGEKPATTTTCNTFTKCDPFSYAVSPWCTRQDDPCREDVVRFKREIQCVDGEGRKTENRNCAAETPASEVECSNVEMYNDLANVMARENGCAQTWTPPEEDPVNTAWDIIRRKIGLNVWGGIL